MTGTGVHDGKITKNQQNISKRKKKLMIDINNS